MFKSTDSGATWAAINNGMTCQYVSALVADPSSPGVLYAGSDSNVFVTTDGGNRWVAATGVVSLFSTSAIAIDPVNPSNVYAGGFAIGRSAPLKSTDSGLTWEAIVEGPNVSIADFIVDPVTPSILYVASESGVFKTSDNGHRWSLVLPLSRGGDVGYPVDMKLDPLDPSTLFVVGSDRIFKSTNHGADWLDVTRQVISPGRISIAPSAVYVGTRESKIYKSIDGGNNWVLLATRDSLGTAFGALAIDPITSSTLYATSLRGIYKSADGGITWINTGGLSSFQVSNLVFDPANPSTMYAYGAGGVRPTDTPRIVYFNIAGKKLFISGVFFDDGAVLLLDGQEQKTKNDGERPTFLLIAKKSAKKITKNPDLKIQVRNVNGKLSNEVTIWPPLN